MFELMSDIFSKLGASAASKRRNIFHKITVLKKGNPEFQTHGDPPNSKPAGESIITSPPDTIAIPHHRCGGYYSLQYSGPCSSPFQADTNYANTPQGG